MKRLRAIDLCCGAGGWAVAARGLPIDIVVAVDHWQAAVDTYKHNHPATCVVRADVRQLPLRPGGFDLVLGGIPCQWLTHLRSIGLGNGVGEAERDANRALLDALLNWTRSSNPRFWCFEDVTALAKELPIFTPHKTIDAKHFSGQRRRRLYVGRFPLPEPNGRASMDARAYRRPGPYRVTAANLKRTVCKHNTWQVGSNVYPVELKPGRKWPTIVTVGSRHDTKYVVLEEHIVGGRRQVEWQEAALAQGFPETYVFVANQSDTNQMIANAVQIDTARAILDAICCSFNSERHTHDLLPPAVVAREPT